MKNNRNLSLRKRAALALIPFIVMAFSTLACKDGDGGDSSWVGDTGTSGNMADVPGNVANGVAVLNDAFGNPAPQPEARQEVQAPTECPAGTTPVGGKCFQLSTP